MAVVYTYYRYIIDKENYKCYIFQYNGQTNVIFSPDTGASREMGNTGDKHEETKKGDKHNKFLDSINKMKKKSRSSCGQGCCKFLAIVFCIAVIVMAIIVIATCVTTAIATKLFTSDLSGRMVALIVLAVTAAVSLSAATYSVAGMFKKKQKSLLIALVLLLVMAVIQALLCGVAVNVTTKDEVVLFDSMRESFSLAKAGNPRHVKLWAITNSDLECCGLYGPEDYRDGLVPPIFSPEIPISCCPNYNSSRSDLLQEAERENCRSTKTYYYRGCGELVKNVFYNSASIVLAVTIVLIILEIILALQTYVMYKDLKRERTLNKLEKSGEANPEAGASKPEK